MRIITKLVLIFYICLLHSTIHARTGNAHRLAQPPGINLADSQNGTVRTDTPKVEDSPSKHGSNTVGAEKAVAPSPAEESPPQYRSTSEQAISYDDVYGLELTLPFAGSVEVSATADEEIIIKLEKYGTGSNEEIVPNIP